MEFSLEFEEMDGQRQLSDTTMDIFKRFSLGALEYLETKPWIFFLL